MSDWKTVKLGDICQIINGSTPLRSNSAYWDNGEIPWFTIEDLRKQGRDIHYTNQCITKMALSKTSLKLLPKDTILLCCTASVGAVAIARVNMATNQQFNGLIPLDKNLVPEYLYYVATTLEQHLLSISGSTTINFIAISKLKEITIQLPPLPEQQRIVAKLDAAFTEIDTAITANKKKQEEVNKLKQAILTNTLQPSKSSAVELLENVCEIQPKKAEIKEQLSNDINVSFMGMNLLGIEKKIATTIVEKPLASVYKNYTYFANNDVLLAKITPCFENGKIGIAQKLKNGVGFGSSEFVVFRCRGKLIPEYLYYFLNQKHFREKGKKNMSGAVGHKRLTKEFINKTLIPLPPLTKQKQIVAKLDTAFTEIDNFTQATKKKIANHKALKSAILTQELQPKKNKN